MIKELKQDVWIIQLKEQDYPEAKVSILLFQMYDLQVLLLLAQVPAERGYTSRPGHVDLTRPKCALYACAGGGGASVCRPPDSQFQNPPALPKRVVKQISFICYVSIIYQRNRTGGGGGQRHVTNLPLCCSNFRTYDHFSLDKNLCFLRPIIFVRFLKPAR